ncbi:hypothetical protein [Lacinutrix sp. Bg11-31]|uniref:hypothetical protein n=1 Tax=Lacinutrix sp. Bg11-31 TaxID=2057808 RepID=UPI000C30280B|nr:hypothetical protein [Lacinutrix sp. Bg11-31]AUC80873.1 hypothetical protein CW733_01470 [Lacinutrix sp. Bg11-31]
MFNKRKNKTFNYNSRFSKDEIKNVKTESDTKSEITSEWKRTRKTGAGKRKVGLPLLILLLGIIIAVMYYLEYKL